MHRRHHRQQTKEEANNNNKSKNARRQRRETLREIKEHAKSALSLNDDRNNNKNNKEKSSSSAGKKRWTNSDWRDAFERLFLDDAETFKEVGMQDDLLFYAPSSSRGTGGAKDVVFVRRWKKREKKNTHVAGGCGGASSGDRNDDNTNNSNNNNKKSNLEDLTTANVDWRATTLLNIVQHTTYSAEVSVCLLDQLEKKQHKSDGGDSTAKGGEDAHKIQREQKGTLANPLASCKTKVFASTSKMAQSNNLKSDRRESTLPEVSFESYYANSEEWEKCALTYDGDCLCVRLFATGGVLRTHLDDDEVATTEAEEEKKIVVFSGFAPRSDVARAYNVERKAAYKQAFTFRAFANSTFGFDLPKLHDGDSNDRRSRRRKRGGSNNSTSDNGVAENGLYDDGYRVNGAHGNSEDYDDDEAEHLDGDVPRDGNRADEDDEDEDGGNNGNSGGEEGGRGTSFLSPYRHHPKSFASPSRGGAGETDAVVTLGRGTEEEGEAAVAVSAEHLHFSPSSAHKSGTSGGFADDDVFASGGSGINSETDYSSAYDTDDTSSSRRAPPPGTSGKISSSAKTNRKGSGGVRRLLNFGRKVETVREVAESVDVTRLRCRLLGVKIHWRALARDLLYKEWR